MVDGKYDYLVVGAGLAGATFAWAARQAGTSALVVDRRDHIAGNCYTRCVESIDVHMYGPHLFHTNSKRIWDFVNRFAEFNDYHHVVVAKTRVGMLSLPINLFTLSKLFAIDTPEEARRYFESVRVAGEDSSTVEGWCLAHLGRELYELLIEGYTVKQWGAHPSRLPSSIVERLPIRLTFDPRYFSDSYQGVPKCGYTQLVANMLDGLDVSLNTDYIEDCLAHRNLRARAA